MRKLAPLLTLLVVAVAGCGSSQSDDQQIRSVVNQFTVSIGQGHYSVACPLTTGSAHGDCEAVASYATSKNPLTLSPSGCVGSDGSQLGQACAGMRLDISVLRSFTNLVIAKVVVTGSTATVTFNGGGGEVFNLSKTQGNWLITAAPPLGKSLSSLPGTPSTPTSP